LDYGDFSFPIAENLSCWIFVAGPGAVGRAIRCRSPKARVDCVDSRLVPIEPLCGTEHGVEMSAKSLLAIYASQTGVQVSLPTTTRSSQANALGWVLRPWRNFSDTCFDCCGRGLFVFLQLGIRRSEVWRGIGWMEAEKADRYDRETWERLCKWMRFPASTTHRSLAQCPQRYRRWWHPRVWWVRLL